MNRYDEIKRLTEEYLSNVCKLISGEEIREFDNATSNRLTETTLAILNGAYEVKFYPEVENSEEVNNSEFKEA